MSKDEAERSGTRTWKRGTPDDRSSSSGYKPVLGLADPADDSPPATDWRDWAGKAAPGTVFDQPEPEELIELTVIVPARNEEDCLGECLQSLVSQSEDIFELGRDWELIVVDDHSTDRTAEIARGFAGVTLLEAGKLEAGLDGEGQRRLDGGAARARPLAAVYRCRYRSTSRATCAGPLHEAERNKVGMLSYSPRQIVRGLAQRSLMPLVFCELALAYPPAKVSDPAQRIAAANGQFLLVEREAYRRLGGHPSVAGKVLEDVELAFLAKRRKVGLRFRYADDAVSARMYRSTGAMIEGWTKNLKLLFNNALVLAVFRALDILSSFWAAGAGLRTLERAVGRSRPGVAGRGMGAGVALAAHAVPVLFAGGEVEFSVPGLRAGAPGPAAVCGAALSQLVPAPHPQARKLEGAELRVVR